MLDDLDDIATFRRAVTPEHDADQWLACNVGRPAICGVGGDPRRTLSTGVTGPAEHLAYSQAPACLAGAKC